MKLFTKRPVYLDNAAATPPDPVGLNRYIKTAQTLFSNPGSIHNEAVDASMDLSLSRLTVADVLHAQVECMVFGRGGTECCNIMAAGIARWLYASRGRPVKVFINPLEHPAVLEPLMHLASQGVVHVQELSLKDDGCIDMDTFRRDIETNSPDFVVCQYVNSEIGVVQPIAEMGRFLLAYNRDATERIYFACDAIQAFNYEPCEVDKLHVDALVVSGSKIYGPRSCAVLYRSRAVQIEPLYYGGGQEWGIRPGTEDPALASHMAYAMKRALALRESERIRLAKIRDVATELICSTIPDVIVNHIPTGSPAIINISIRGCDSEYLVLAMDDEGYIVNSQSACGARSGSRSRILTRIWNQKGLSGEGYADMRISMGRETTMSDMKRCVKILADIVKKYRSWQ